MSSALQKVERLLALVTYKPGWKFNAWVDRYSDNWSTRLYINISWRMPDINHPGKDITLNWNESLCASDIEHMEEKDVIEYFIWKAIFKAEEHEMHEWYKVDGFCVFDPHPELAARGRDEKVGP